MAGLPLPWTQVLRSPASGLGPPWQSPLTGGCYLIADQDLLLPALLRELQERVCLDRHGREFRLPWPPDQTLRLHPAEGWLLQLVPRMGPPRQNHHQCHRPLSGRPCPASPPSLPAELPSDTNSSRMMTMKLVPVSLANLALRTLKAKSVLSYGVYLETSSWPHPTPSFWF